MKLVYLDESGTGSVEQNPILVVAGVVIDADRQLLEVENRLRELADQYVLPEQRRGFVIHMRELANGGKREINGYRPNSWPSLADAMCEVIRDFHMPVVARAIPRARLAAAFPKGNYEKDLRYATTLGAQNCAIDVDESLVQACGSTEVGVLVFESNGQFDRHVLEGVNYLRFGFGSPDNPESRSVKRVRLSPLFESKAHAPALQLADFCAYVVRRFLANERNVERWFRRLDPQITRHAIFYGPGRVEQDPATGEKYVSYKFDDSVVQIPSFVYRFELPGAATERT